MRGKNLEYEERQIHKRRRHHSTEFANTVGTERKVANYTFGLGSPSFSAIALSAAVFTADFKESTSARNFYNS
jgi:hypothetical protein